jgi:hypothetical protein
MFAIRKHSQKFTHSFLVLSYGLGQIYEINVFNSLYEISDSHGGEYEDDSFLGYSTL